MGLRFIPRVETRGYDLGRLTGLFDSPPEPTYPFSLHGSAL